MQPFLDPKQFLLKKRPFLPTVLRAPRELTKGRQLETGIQLLDLLSGGWTVFSLWSKLSSGLYQGPTYTQRCKDLGRKKDEVQLMSDDFSPSECCVVGRVKVRSLRIPAHHWSAGETEAHRKCLPEVTCWLWTVPWGQGNGVSILVSKFSCFTSLPFHRPDLVWLFCLHHKAYRIWISDQDWTHALCVKQSKPLDNWELLSDFL